MMQFLLADREEEQIKFHMCVEHVRGVAVSVVSIRQSKSNNILQLYTRVSVSTVVPALLLDAAPSGASLPADRYSSSSGSSCTASGDPEDVCQHRSRQR